MRIGGPPPGILGGPHEDDEDEDEGVPPEILELMKMTEMMVGGSGLG